MRNISLLSLLVFLILAPNAVFGQWSIDPTVNNLVYTGTWTIGPPNSLPDGQGGAFIVWSDNRATGFYLYAQRLDNQGNRLWDVDCVRVCTYQSNQEFFDVVTDMAGGIIVVWEDETSSGRNIYAQRISPDGELLWNSSGQAVCTYVESQSNPCADSDGQGGVIVGWRDFRNDDSDIYAQRLDPAGAQLWPNEGVPVCTATDHQSRVQVLSDSGGGGTFTWLDSRDPEGNGIYARRVNYLGTPIWGDNGNLVSTYFSHCAFPTIVSDGSQGYLITYLDMNYSSGKYYPWVHRLNAAGTRLWSEYGVQAGQDEVPLPLSYSAESDSEGGVFLAWRTLADGKTDLLAQRVNQNGTLVWGLSGRVVCSAEGSQDYPCLVPDGQGGTYITWFDTRNNGSYYNGSLYGQRLDAFGNALWNDQGNLVQLGSADYFLTSTTDGNGGLIVAWIDTRNSAYHIYAQRMDDTGYLGAPDPSLNSVIDMPNDQGGQVNLTWTPGYLDAMPWHAVTSYSVWMKQPEAAKQTESDLSPDQRRELGRQLGCTPEKLNDLAKSGWTFVQQVPAMLEPEYGCLAPTFGDSTAFGIIATLYRVVGHGENPWITWESPSVLGYSVDNLSPGAPLALAGQWSTPTEVLLQWQPSGSHDEDLGLYHVYRSETAGFEPGLDNLTGTATDVSFVDDVGGGTWYYQVAAVDVHGNESPASNEVCLTSASPVPEARPTQLALHPNYPNPFNPSTCISFDLPQAGQVNLAVYSVDGARVATLLSKIVPAGSHQVQWNGTDTVGRAMPAGMYFIQLNSGRFSQTRSMVLVR